MFNSNPGDKLWFIVPSYSKAKWRLDSYPGKQIGDLIIPVTVEEVDDIFTGPNNDCIWGYRHLDSKNDHIMVPTGEKDELGWPIHRPESWSKVVELGLRLNNQYVYIDEPVGHHIKVDEHDGSGDGLFSSLNEALKYSKPSNKKRLRRRLNEWRAGHISFIASTWKRNGEKHPGFPVYLDKKIIVRKK